MIRLPMFNSSRGRLDTGERQTGKMEYLFGGALGLVIIASLTLAIINVMSGGGGGGVIGEQHFWCDTAGDGEFTVDPQNDPVNNPDNKDYMQAGQYDNLPIHACPKCHKKAWGMYKCPSCGKYYAPDKALRDIRTMSKGVDKCPSCNTVREEWYKTHPKK